MYGHDVKASDRCPILYQLIHYKATQYKIGQGRWKTASCGNSNAGEFEGWTHKENYA
jgi:hypothetical protein